MHLNCSRANGMLAVCFVYMLEWKYPQYFVVLVYMSCTWTAAGRKACFKYVQYFVVLVLRLSFVYATHLNCSRANGMLAMCFVYKYCMLLECKCLQYFAVLVYMCHAPELQHGERHAFKYVQYFVWLAYMSYTWAATWRKACFVCHIHMHTHI